MHSHGMVSRPLNPCSESSAVRYGSAIEEFLNKNGWALLYSTYASVFNQPCEPRIPIDTHFPVRY